MSSKRELIIKIAKMYYTFGMSQKDIASDLEISRGYVCQLLDQARQNGIVEIKIHEDHGRESDIEAYTRQLFNLQKAIIVEAPQKADRQFISNEVYSEACQYLDSVIANNMVVAYAWGNTIYQVSNRLKKHSEITNITTLPLCGGTSNLQKKIYVSEISTNIAEAYNGTPLFIPLPAILQSQDIKQAVYSDSNIQKVLELSRRADIALFTVGSLLEENIIYRGGYIDQETMENLVEKGSVGDLCAHFINQKGEICDEELDERTVSIGLDDFKKIKHKICVAMGSAKIRSLLAVLRHRYVDVLITDEATIKEVLNEI